MVIECRFHARGGQGNVVLTELMVWAFHEGGKMSQGFPFFSFERRGAPATAYVRIGEERVLHREVAATADIVGVLDAGLVETIPWYQGLKEGGMAVLNTKRAPDEVRVPVKLSRVGVVDATGLGFEVFGTTRGLGIPPTNTAILGAFVKTTGLLKLDHAINAIKHKWRGRIADLNVKAVTTAYERTQVGRF
ncbi:MAG: 2-oxoacid:acceptor oxidoreductase family protein [Candidatus Bathyarchaeia archaeon]